MEVNLRSSDLLSPNESMRDCMDGIIGLLSLISRSAPSRSAAWLSISWRRLLLKEYIATKAAIPKIMDDINSNKRERLRLLSRQAINASHGKFMSPLYFTWSFSLAKILNFN